MVSHSYFSDPKEAPLNDQPRSYLQPGLLEGAQPKEGHTCGTSSRQSWDSMAPTTVLHQATYHKGKHENFCLTLYCYLIRMSALSKGFLAISPIAVSFEDQTNPILTRLTTTTRSHWAWEPMRICTRARTCAQLFEERLLSLRRDSHFYTGHWAHSWVLGKSQSSFGS